MILTVTPDPVLDKILIIPTWTPGIPMRTEQSVTSVGGKGLDASVALAQLGVQTQAVAILAGRTGQELLEQVQAYGIDLHPLWSAGETRTATIIAEQETQRHSHIFSGGLTCIPADPQKLLALTEQLLPGSPWLVMGGILPTSLPQDIYYQLTQQAQQAGVPVLIDAHSAYLQAVLPARPQIVKLNWKEFEWTFERPARNFDELVQAARQVYERGQMEALVITCSAAGILALTPTGDFQAQAPAQMVVNAAGAGDAASGALGWRLSQQDSWPAALRWAAAASAAVVRTQGTADLDTAVVQELLPQVIVSPLPKEHPTP